LILLMLEEDEPAIVLPTTTWDVVVSEEDRVARRTADVSRRRLIPVMMVVIGWWLLTMNAPMRGEGSNGAEGEWVLWWKLWSLKLEEELFAKRGERCCHHNRPMFISRQKWPRSYQSWYEW
jgi:hypothetical protein